MEEELKACNIKFFSLSTLVALCVCGIIIARKIIQRAPGVMKAVRDFAPSESPLMFKLHKEVGELRKATLQITHDWQQMITLTTSLRDHQFSFAKRLEVDLDSIHSNLQRGLIDTLQEEHKRNEQRFGKLKGTIDALREDLDLLKELSQQALLERDSRSGVLVENGTQTINEVVKKKVRDETPGESGNPRTTVAVIRQMLCELLREVKKHMSEDREQLMQDLRILFSHLSEDRVAVRSAIDQAFTTASHHSQQSLEQLSAVGKEAMKCIAVLNDKSENSIRTSFQDHGDKLGIIFEGLKDLNFDVSAIKHTLDNIDGQFDEIFKRIETGCQKNTEHCEEMSTNLNRTSEEWRQKAIGVDQLSLRIADVTDELKHTLQRLNCADDFQPADRQCLTLKDTVLTDANVTAVLQVCYSKLSMFQEQTESGTSEIKKSVDGLIGKLTLLSNLVDSSVKRLTNMSMECASGEGSGKGPDIEREFKEFMGDVLKLNDTQPEDAGVKMVTKEAAYPEAMAVIESNLNAALKTKCMRDIGKNSKSIVSGNRKPSPKKRPFGRETMKEGKIRSDEVD